MAQIKTKKNPRKDWLKAYFIPSDIVRIERAAKAERVSVSSFIASAVLKSLTTREEGRV